MRIITTVCTGNICRSPMAEYLLQDELAKAGEEDVVVNSAGIYALEGNSAASQAQRVMAEHGIDIAPHRAQQLTPAMIDAAEMLLVMERSHLHAILALSPKAAKKTFLMATFAKNDAPPEVGDPYGGGDNGFVVTYETLRSASEALAKKIAGGA